MKTVLFADDNDEIIEIVRLALANSNYELITANNGKDAIHICLEKQPALVLMDINMPELNGFDSIRQLREKGYTNPIIVLTASEDNKDRMQAKSAGCTDYILKTVDMENVEAIVNHYIGEFGELIE